MDESKIKKLEEIGINYHLGVERFMGDTELYESVLTAFLEDNLLDRTIEAYNKEDYEGLFDCVHECKGSCGNLDMTVLYNLSKKMVDILRNNKKKSEELTAVYNEFVNKYKNIRECLQSLL